MTQNLIFAEPAVAKRFVVKWHNVHLVGVPAACAGVGHGLQIETVNPQVTSVGCVQLQDQLRLMQVGDGCPRIRSENLV